MIEIATLENVLVDNIYNDLAFTKILDEQVGLHGRTRKAVAETIRVCKGRNLLKQYLTEHEQEVQSIMITLFDNETILKAYTKEKEDAAEARGEIRGEARGEAKGRKKKTIEAASNLIKEGMAAEVIARVLDLPISEVNALKEQITS